MRTWCIKSASLPLSFWQLSAEKEGHSQHFAPSQLLKWIWILRSPLLLQYLLKENRAHPVPEAIVIVLYICSGNLSHCCVWLLLKLGSEWDLVMLQQCHWVFLLKRKLNCGPPFRHFLASVSLMWICAFQNSVAGWHISYQITSHCVGATFKLRYSSPGLTKFGHLLTEAQCKARHIMSVRGEGCNYIFFR